MAETVNSEIKRIKDAKASIKASIEAKGVTVGEGTIDTYAGKIDEIQAGGTTGPIRMADHPDMRLGGSTFKTFTNEEYDFSGVTDMSCMFEFCNNLTTLPVIDTSKVTNMDKCFNSSSSLTTLPMIDTSKVTSMNNCFYYCQSLTSIPALDTSNVTNMGDCFNYCLSLTSIPALDTSNVTNMAHMFDGCRSLTSIPALDTSKVTDMDNLFGYSTINNLTGLGGFIGLKIDWNDNYGLALCPNLTHQSVLNVINGLYDFRGNGDAETTRTIQFHSSSLALLTPEETAIATNKGWNLIS